MIYTAKTENGTIFYSSISQSHADKLAMLYAGEGEQECAAVSKQQATPVTSYWWFLN